MGVFEKKTSIVFQGFDDAKVSCFFPHPLQSGTIQEMYEKRLLECGRSGKNKHFIDRNYVLQGETLHFGVAVFCSLDAPNSSQAHTWLEKYKQITASVNLHYSDENTKKENSSGSVDHAHLQIVSIGGVSDICVEKKICHIAYAVLSAEHSPATSSDEAATESYILFSFSIPICVDALAVEKFLRICLSFEFVPPIVETEKRTESLSEYVGTPISHLSISEGINISFTEVLQAKLEAPTVFQSQIPWSSAFTSRPLPDLVRPNAGINEAKESGDDVALIAEKKEIELDAEMNLQKANAIIEVLGQAVIAPIIRQPSHHDYTSSLDNAISPPTEVGSMELSVNVIKPFNITSSYHGSLIFLYITNATDATGITIRDVRLQNSSICQENNLPIHLNAGEAYGIVSNLNPLWDKSKKLHCHLIENEATNADAANLTKLAQSKTHMNYVSDMITKDEHSTASVKTVPCNIKWCINSFTALDLWSQTELSVEAMPTDLLEVVVLRETYNQNIVNVKLSLKNNNSDNMDLDVFVSDELNDYVVGRNLSTVNVATLKAIPLTLSMPVGCIHPGGYRSIELQFFHVSRDNFILPPLLMLDSLKQRHFLFTSFLNPAN